jgi:hypothetical protein
LRYSLHPVMYILVVVHSELVDVDSTTKIGWEIKLSALTCCSGRMSPRPVTGGACSGLSSRMEAVRLRATLRSKDGSGTCSRRDSDVEFSVSRTPYLAKAIGFWEETVMTKAQSQQLCLRYNTDNGYASNEPTVRFG